MSASPPVLPSPRFPRERLLELVRVLSGVEVAWATRARGQQGLRPLSEHAWIYLSAQAIVRDGVDEVRRQWNQATNLYDVILIGQRQATLVVDAYSVDPDLEVIDLCERVAFRLRTQVAQDMMRPTIALIDALSVTSLPGLAWQNRLIMRASMDVRIAYVLASDPMDPGEGNWIETVEVPGPVPTPGTNGPGLASGGE